MEMAINSAIKTIKNHISVANLYWNTLDNDKKKEIRAELSAMRMVLNGIMADRLEMFGKDEIGEFMFYCVIEDENGFEFGYYKQDGTWVVL